MEQREKNNVKQQQYREKIKTKGQKRITLIVKNGTYDRIKQIAHGSGVSQGEVIDRIFEGGIEKMTPTAIKENVVKTTLERFKYEDYRLSELGIDAISSVLALNSLDILKEESLDSERYRELVEQRKSLLKEQKMIYKGNKEAMKNCIEKHGPIIRASFDELN